MLDDELSRQIGAAAARAAASLSRWLLWRRTLVALDMLQAVSATQAAHEAGFADGAEFCRRFRESFAAAPTAAVQDPRIRAVVCSRLQQRTA